MASLRERKKRAVKERIQRSAGEMFVKQGYERTTITQIAQLANIGVGTFYNYFSSKAELFLDVFVRDTHYILAEEVNRILDNPGENIESTLQLLLNKYFDVLLRIDKTLFQEIITVIVSNPKQYHKNLHQCIDLDLEVIEQLIQFFSVYQKRGMLPDDFNVRDGAECVFGIITTQVLMFYIYQCVNDFDTVKENVYRQLKTFLIPKFIA